LVKNYRPADDVVKKIKNLKILIIIGPSGAGKTTLIKNLGLPYIPSDITRKRRPEEKEGEDYFFREDYSKILDDMRAGRFVQAAVGPGGDFYSTKGAAYPESGVATMAVVADVVPIFRQLGFGQTISVFILPPTYKEWMRRIHDHKTTDEQMEKRLAEAERSFKFALGDSQTHLVLNDNISDCTSRVEDLLGGKVDEAKEQEAHIICHQLLECLQNRHGLL